MTNCKNCGAPIDPNREACPFCSTPYPGSARAVLRGQAVGEGLTSGIDHALLSNVYPAMLLHSILTPNEYRALVGLPVKEKEG